MRLFWWLYCLIFAIAGVVKMNDAYLYVAGMFAIASAISELGWKVRNVIDKLNKSLYEDGDGRE